MQLARNSVREELWPTLALRASRPLPLFEVLCRTESDCAFLMRTLKFRSVTLHVAEIWKDVFYFVSHEKCHSVQLAYRWFRTILSERLNKGKRSVQCNPSHGRAGRNGQVGALTERRS